MANKAVEAVLAKTWKEGQDDDFHQGFDEEQEVQEIGGIERQAKEERLATEEEKFHMETKMKAFQEELTKAAQNNVCYQNRIMLLVNKCKNSNRM